MAKIISITPATRTSQTANPFKTSRSSVTNPFKYSNFEGNTLQFADVFEGFEPKNISKMKLVASSVAGTMHRMKTGITESVVNFVKRVKSDVTSAWEYAKNTNISDIAIVKRFNEIMNTPVEIPGSKILSGKIEALKSRFSTNMGVLNENMIDLGKDMQTRWQALINKIQPKKITAETPVSELEALWKAEIAVVELGGIS